jgi:hypothetical protein
MDKHVTILGVLYIGLNIPLIIAAVIVFIVLAGSGLLSGDVNGLAFMTGLATVIFYFLIILAIPSILGGIGLLKRKKWARILVLILGCLNLPSIPFGTALGIYTLWVLIKDETVALFE